MKANKIRKAVRKTYAAVARQGSSCCGPAEPCECGTGDQQTSSRAMGYSAKELKSAPKGANMGLGCGNPVAIASLKTGDTVVDLGSGGGFDCFLAANKVGKKGRVIGVDMTPEMIEKARENAEKVKSTNVEFRLGEIEHLPVADKSANVVISNCVINLASDKEAVLKEAYRVLKNGGRIAISDLALIRELPRRLKASMEAYTSCIGGAIMLGDYKQAVKAVGFRDIRLTTRKVAGSVSAIDEKKLSPSARKKLKTARLLASNVVSVYIQAIK